MILATFFLVTCFVVFSYVVDMSRAQLIRHKLYVVSDMASLAAATAYDRDMLQGKHRTTTPALPEMYIHAEEAANMARIYVDYNQTDKGGRPWMDKDIKFLEQPFAYGYNDESKDVNVVNDISDFTAYVTITTHFTLSPMLFSGIFPDTPISASARSVSNVSFY
ncbi:MAG: Tad domain-containing protein [archaeon]